MQSEQTTNKMSYEIKRVYTDKEITLPKGGFNGAAYESVEIAKKVLEALVEPYLDDKRFDVLQMENGRMFLVNKKGKAHFTTLYYITEYSYGD